MTPGAESSLVSQQGARKAMASSASPLIQRTTPLVSVDIEITSESLYQAAARDSFSDGSVQSPAVSISSPGGQDASNEFTWSLQKNQVPLEADKTVEPSVTENVPVIAPTSNPVTATSAMNIGTELSSTEDEASVDVSGSESEGEARTVEAITELGPGTTEPPASFIKPFVETELEIFPGSVDESLHGKAPGTLSGAVVEVVKEIEPGASTGKESESPLGTEPSGTFTGVFARPVIESGPGTSTGTVDESLDGKAPSGTLAGAFAHPVIETGPGASTGRVNESLHGKAPSGTLAGAFLQPVVGTGPETSAGKVHETLHGTEPSRTLAEAFVEPVVKAEPGTSVGKVKESLHDQKSSRMLAGTFVEVVAEPGTVTATVNTTGQSDTAAGTISRTFIELPTELAAQDLIGTKSESVYGAAPEVRPGTSTEPGPLILRSISEQSEVSEASECFETNRRMTETDVEVATMPSSDDDLNLTIDAEADRRLTEEVVQIRQQIHEMIDADRVFISPSESSESAAPTESDSESESESSSNSDLESSNAASSVPTSPSAVVVMRRRTLSESTQSSVDDLKRRLSQARLSFILSNFDVNDLEQLPLPPPPPPDWNPPLQLSPKSAAPPIPAIGPRGESFRLQLTPSTIPAPPTCSPPPETDEKPVGGVAVMPGLGADLLSKFRKDKEAKSGGGEASAEKTPEVLVKTTSRRIGSVEDDVFTGHVVKSGSVSPVPAGVTRSYTYEAEDGDEAGRRRFEPQGVGAFRYDGQTSPGPASRPKSPEGGSGKKATGLAFSYTPGEEAQSLAEAGRGLKSTSPVPTTAKSAANAPTVPAASSAPAARAGIEINPINMDYVESAALKSKAAAAAEPTPITSGKEATNGKAEGTRGYKRSRPGERGTASDESDDDASLDEYEEHKQPQTEEIMNAQLARETRQQAEAATAAVIASTTAAAAAAATSTAGAAPQIVKTTTKQTVVQSADGYRHNKEEKVEDLTPGGSGAVTVVSSSNKAELPEDLTGSGASVPHVKATQVTTRTALTKEDKEKNSTTSQIEEKTFTATTMTTAHRQEQRVVTQEVRTATILTSAEPTQEPPIVKTESVKYDPSSLQQTVSGASATSAYPFVPTESRKVGGDIGVADPEAIEPVAESPPTMPVKSGPVVTTLMEEGQVISTQNITSKTRTVETVTYKKEHDGLVETRVEQKITIQSDGDPIDHDRALAEAIQEATAMNPDMTVEKIEIQQQAVPQ